MSINLATYKALNERIAELRAERDKLKATLDANVFWLVTQAQQAEAVETEREACAVEADKRASLLAITDYEKGYQRSALNIAAAIRARSSE